MGLTHIVWLPDSAMGPWETAILATPSLELVRVCREGEAWAVAAGLHLGGKRPLVAIQNTGLFESGDAMRNVLFDLRLPLFSLIGYRSYLVENSPDTAKQFTEPILRAWGVDYVLIDSPHARGATGRALPRMPGRGQAGSCALGRGARMTLSVLGGTP